jgi:hypothetical protein
LKKHGAPLGHRTALHPRTHTGQCVATGRERIRHAADLTGRGHGRDRALGRFVGIEGTLVVDARRLVQGVLADLAVESAQLLAERGDVFVGESLDLGQLDGLLPRAGTAVLTLGPDPPGGVRRTPPAARRVSIPSLPPRVGPGRPQ